MSNIKNLKNEIDELKKMLHEKERLLLQSNIVADKNKNKNTIVKKITVKGKKNTVDDLGVMMAKRMNEIKKEQQLNKKKQIQHYNKVKTIYKAIQNNGLFLINFKITFFMTYHKSNGSSFTTPLQTRDFSYSIEETNKPTVKRNIKKIIELFLSEMNNEYMYYTLVDILEYQIMDSKTIKKNAVYNILKAKMKMAFPIEFSWVPNIKFENNGLCAYNALSALKKKPKIFNNPDELLKKFQSYEEEDNAILEEQTEQLTLNSGVSPTMIQRLCEEFDITHYCLDIENQLLLKNISKNRNWEPICYITHANHMYLITDKEFINKLSFNRSTKNNFVGMLRKEEEKDDVNKEIQGAIFTITPTKYFKKLKDCTIIRSTNNLQDTLIELYRLDGTLYKHTCRNNKIIKIDYLNNVVVLADPNYNGSMYDDYDMIDWMKVRQLCYKKKIHFVNQSFPNFVMQIINNTIKPKRIQLTKEQKENIKKEQNDYCNICESKLLKAEFDHIIPLASSGDNNLNNIQALCLPCHFKKTQNESENGEYVSIGKETSTFNNTTKKIIHSDLFKRYAFVERLADVPSKFKTFYIDINKTRRNILYYLKHMSYKLPVFTCMDEPKKYEKNDSIEAGFYFIESLNYFPLRGNGWYSHAMVLYCLENKIITEKNIKWKLESSLTLDHEYFNKSIDELLTLPNGLSKLAPNILIGCSARDVSIKSKTYFTNDFKQASTMFMRNKNSNAFIHDLNGLYQITTSEKIDLDISNSCIYNMIVDIEALELHKLKTIIEQNKGTVTFLNTDCCECYFPDNKPMSIKNYYWDKQKTIEKYKFEFKTVAPAYERMKKFEHFDSFEFDRPEWNIINDPLTNDFASVANQIIEKNQSFNLNGCAGSGKTSMLRTIMKQLTEKGLKYQVLCPTNKSARVVSKDAITIHKFLAKSFSNIKSLKKQIEGLKYIIIDEISMVREVFYKVFLSIKAMSDVKFIIAGDWRQLKPVNDRADFDYKNSLALLELCDANRLELTKCRRSDDKLFKASLSVNSLNTTEYDNKEYDISIAWTNEKRKKVNEKWMNLYSSKVQDKMYINKLSYDKDSQDMILYKGLPIIARINCRKYDICNNETFTIKKIDTDKIIITDEGNDKEILIGDFIRLFHPAYCITVHKCQGTTINKPFTIYQWKHFDESMKYTALTRGTKIENINFA